MVIRHASDLALMPVIPADPAARGTHLWPQTMELANAQSSFCGILQLQRPTQSSWSWQMVNIGIDLWLKPVRAPSS